MYFLECKDCEDQLANLLLDSTAVAPVVSAHLADCTSCRTQLEELRATMALMDEWGAPEPSAFFDIRLHARLRKELSAEPESLWERLDSFLRFSTGYSFRPILAGSLGLVILLGGGSAATYLAYHGSRSAASPTVNDLKIYDNNAQAVDQMDLLDDAVPSADDAPQS